VAYAQKNKTTAREVHNNKTHLAAFQSFIRSQGIETDWPETT
jgi:hypothetical protein